MAHRILSQAGGAIPGRIIQGAALLGVFALYVPAIRLVLLHDDAVIIPGIRDRTILDIFQNRPLDVLYRPMSYAPWLLARDWFGWFTPGVLHMWNVWAHVLNTALVMVLAAWLGRRLSHHSAVFPVTSGLIFGLFPLSYQAILWASALVHPLMTSFGLLAMLTYIRSQSSRQRRMQAGALPVQNALEFRKWGWVALSSLFLVAACLSHEMGFLFGILILFVELLNAWIGKRRVSVHSVPLVALAVIYPLLYFTFIRTPWSNFNSSSYRASLADMPTNMLYFIQGMVFWIVALARPVAGLTDSRALLLVLFFVISVGVATVLQYRYRLLTLAVLALAWWAVAAVPAVALLSEPYVRFGPRLLYVSSIGIALFWGLLLAVMCHLFRRPVFRAALLIPAAVLSVWCVTYIMDRTDETARLMPAMRLIDTEVHRSPADATVLFINLPWWNAPSYPSFFIGAEGMSIFQHDGAPSWTWLASLSGTRRETVYVRHDGSLTRGDRYVYGIAGQPVDDHQLRALLVPSNFVYRFDYDAPGLRVTRLAMIGRDPTSQPPLARFSSGFAQAALRSGRAAMCGSDVVVDLAWSDVRRIDQPAAIFVHVFDVDKRQAIVADRDLVDGYLPLDQIPAGVVISETRLIRIPAEASTLEDVRVGAYWRADGQRLTATRADGAAWEEDAVVIPIASGDAELCSRASDWPDSQP